MPSATYDPGDNKIRIYTAYKGEIAQADIDRMKAQGFRWAGKQELWVAPMWTPEREDLAEELCGEIEDEDKSLVERAEERAERFEDYRDNRAQDADRARAAVSAIADNIPFGQKILIGHHSQRHAERDAAKIENGMRKTIRLWEQSKYWQDRAKGAIRHAKYKERPDVRTRRIKGIEADKRKQEKYKAEAEKGLRFWRGEMKLKKRDSEESFTLAITEENRELIHNLVGGVLGQNVSGFYVFPDEGRGYGGWSAWDVLQPEEKRYKACPPGTVAQCQEAAERALPVSIARYDRWIAHYENRLAYERAMLEESGGTAADKTGPEKGGGCRCWASPGYGKGWSYIQKVNQVSVTVLDNWGNGGANFTRTIPFDKLTSVMSAAEVNHAREEGRLHETDDKTGFYLDDKVETREEAKDRIHQEALARVEQEEKDAEFKAMQATLKAGVQTVVAPQLFPTPAHVVEQMLDLAELDPEHRVLEPSAGTGVILDALRARGITNLCYSEVNIDLVKRLREKGYDRPYHYDFLDWDIERTQASNFGFDRILMNPPFSGGDDIKHILHAGALLRPNGRLVAICANGPRQFEKLHPYADTWEELPEGTFANQGTNVRTVLLTINRVT